MDALRAMVDAGPGADWYATFLPSVIPAAVAALAATPVDTALASPAHRLRAAVVDLFARLPPTEALRAHADAVCGACVTVFGAGDAEEVAASAARAALDMHKAFRPALEVRVKDNGEERKRKREKERERERTSERESGDTREHKGRPQPHAPSRPLLSSLLY